MWMKVFGFALAGGVVLTSAMIAWMGGRWQKVEASAYAGEKRPAWFWVLSLLVVGLYAAALIDFIQVDKTWAGWLLMVIIPVGWAAKAALVTLNPSGRQSVSSISGDTAWQKIALARLPGALILGGLAWLA